MRGDGGAQYSPCGLTPNGPRRRRSPGASRCRSAARPGNPDRRIRYRRSSDRQGRPPPQRSGGTADRSSLPPRVRDRARVPSSMHVRPSVMRPRAQRVARRLPRTLRAPVALTFPCALRDCASFRGAREILRYGDRLTRNHSANWLRHGRCSVSEEMADFATATATTGAGR